MRLTIFLFIFITTSAFSLKAQVLNKKEIIHFLSVTNKSDSNFIISSSYADASTGLSHVYLQQTYMGIPVYNQIKSLTFLNGDLQYIAGNFISNIANVTNQATPTFSAKEAIKNVATHLRLSITDSLIELYNTYLMDKKIIYSTGNIAKQNIKTQLVWASNDEGNTFRLAWNISIDVINSTDYWNLNIDAADGKIISQTNFTVYESPHSEQRNTSSFFNKKIIDNENLKKIKVASAPPPSLATTVSYNVIPYPYESRFVGNVAVETNPWTKVGTNNNATTYGWQFDSLSNYNFTRGNNVFVYDDSLNKNTPGRADTTTTTFPTLTFKRNFDFTQVPTTTINRQFSTDNLFYWNNIMHDLFYQYGFNEAAGNFQQSNLGRGGIGGDYVFAENQDGGGIDNANFATPPDGYNPRMQMYLYSPKSNLININSPSTIAGSYYARESNVSPNNLMKKVGSRVGNVIFYNDSATITTTHYACKAPANNISGKIAFIYVSGCSYTTQIKNAQLAGAIAAVVCNSAGTQLTMNGLDSSITMPAVMVDSGTGRLIASQLKAGMTVNVSIYTAINFDGAIDNGIVTHEYTHGISNRLTGGPNNCTCLTNKEQAGEGWSDYIGLMMTTNWSMAKLTDGIKRRTHACYAYSQVSDGNGNRTYPYSTDMTIDPHTYADIITNGEIHYTGEVWCSALWDMTWNIIQQVGSISSNLFNPNNTGGNIIALQLVINGLKLQPCSPGFLDSRDAILAADSILFKSRFHCAIWSAFARRGMGYSAIQGSSNSTTDEVVAFDIPCYTISGKIINPLNTTIPNVTLTDSVNVKGVATQKITVNGNYSDYLYGKYPHIFRPSKNNDVNRTNGVTVADISLIQAHIQNKILLGSPFKIIAADVDNSGNVDILDMISIKRLLLGIDTAFKGNRKWAFIDSNFLFTNPQNPFPFRDSIAINNMSANKSNQSFIGVKLGDVNYDWNATILGTINRPLPIHLFYNPKFNNQNNEIHIPIRIKNCSNILAMQFTLSFNSELLQFKGVENNLLNVDMGINHSTEGNISFLWLDNNGLAKTLPDSSLILELIFTRLGNVLNEKIKLTSNVTQIAAYDANYNEIPMQSEENLISDEQSNSESWSMSPNPNNGLMNIVMNLQTNKSVIFELTNINGKHLLDFKTNLNVGNNTVSLNLNQKGKLAKGIYLLKAIGLNGTNVKQVIIQ